MNSETDIYSIYLKVSGIIVSIYGVLCIVVITFCYGYIFSEARL